MPAFDNCVPQADVHYFPNEHHPCRCGFHANQLVAEMTMDLVKKARRQCMISGCKPGPWEKPAVPECEWQLVRLCTNCLRGVTYCCQCPNVCDAHGLHVE